jgi:glycolate oxidase FAD binding subunit
MNDRSLDILEQVRTARARRQAVSIVGGGSKHFLGHSVDAPLLNVAEHVGIVQYEPRELVLTVRAGTTIAMIEETLARQTQQLGFEPPRFDDNATIGGTLACNACGPARPWRGSIRDAVLGVRIVTGKAEHLRFGGQVMKNVAGFDVSRLQAGAYGALGVVTEMSLRVVPVPAAETTLVQECTADRALERMAQFGGEPQPLTGAAWVDGRLYLRLSGNANAVAATAARWGGERAPAVANFWAQLRDHQLPFFRAEQTLWRVAVKPTAPLPPGDSAWLIDWGGAQRFLHADQLPEAVSALTTAAGGYVTALRRRAPQTTFMPDPPAAIKALHLRLKRAFDPDRILNPGRLYHWL